MLFRSCSFLTQEEFFDIVEPYFGYVTEKVAGKNLKFEKFLRIPYDEAIDKYGTDKPDLRYDMTLVDITNECKDSGVNIFKEVEVVKGILVDRKFSKSEIESLTKDMKLEGAKDMLWFVSLCSALKFEHP